MLTSMENGPNALPLLLRLPTQVRQRIYAYAGISLSNQGYHRFLSLDARWTSNEYRYTYDDHYRVTHSLLMTCKTIYEEVVASVYSDCSFEVSYHCHRKLDSLRRLGHSAIRALRELTICLKVTSCPSGDPCVSRDRYSLTDDEANDSEKCALEANEPLTKEIMDEWRVTWSDHLRPFILPSRLRLNLVCDVKDKSTGNAAVLPFLDRTQPQPLLAGCSIRLGRRRDPELESLAQRAVLEMTGGFQLLSAIQASQTSFRFPDLPSELRLHILSFTDLVTPNEEVEWNTDDKMYLRNGTSDCEPWRNVYSDPITPCWQLSRPLGCFCRAYHAAYSTMYLCKCWAPPTAIFLVNHKMRQEALEVFYSRNKFVVTPDHTTWELSDPATPMRASMFLTEVLPRDSLRFIRHLELVFLPLGDVQAYRGGDNHRGWNDTLEAVSPHLNLPSMTIELSFTESPESRGDHEYSQKRKHIGKEGFGMARQAYMEVVATFKQLEGLGRFFVYFMDRLPEGKPASRKEMERLDEIMASLEQEAEKMVMGTDYDAKAVGKQKTPTSRWLDHHNNWIFYQMFY